jgi:hypothetical protein
MQCRDQIPLQPVALCHCSTTGTQSTSAAQHQASNADAHSTTGPHRDQHLPDQAAKYDQRQSVKPVVPTEMTLREEINPPEVLDWPDGNVTQKWLNGQEPPQWTKQTKWVWRSSGARKETLPSGASSVNYRDCRGCLQCSCPGTGDSQRLIRPKTHVARLKEQLTTPCNSCQEVPKALGQDCPAHLLSYSVEDDILAGCFTREPYEVEEVAMAVDYEMMWFECDKAAGSRPWIDLVEDSVVPRSPFTRISPAIRSQDLGTETTIELSVSRKRKAPQHTVKHDKPERKRVKPPPKQSKKRKRSSKGSDGDPNKAPRKSN